MKKISKDYKSVAKDIPSLPLKLKHFFIVSKTIRNQIPLPPYSDLLFQIGANRQQRDNLYICVRGVTPQDYHP